MTDDADDLAELLAPRPAPMPEHLRAELLRRTTSRLQRARWLQRGFRAAGFVAVLALGGAIGWLVRPAPQHSPQEIAHPEVVFVPVPVVIPVPIPTENGSAGERPIVRELSGSQWELQAEQEDDPNAAAMLLKKAGDAFLREDDYANASRCYRLYLYRSGDAALSLQPDDSWLLTSLKNAALQEKARVAKTDS
jgi:hypothetical protein